MNAGVYDYYDSTPIALGLQPGVLSDQAVKIAQAEAKTRGVPVVIFDESDEDSGGYSVVEPDGLWRTPSKEELWNLGM